MTFWILIVVLTVIAVSLCVIPLIMGGSGTSQSEVDAEVAVLRDRRDEIERDRLAGRLSETDAQQAQEELVDALASRIESTDSTASTGSRKSLITAAALAIAIPVSAYWMYSIVGQPSVGAYLADNSFDKPPNASEVGEMVNEIVRRTQTNPDDAEAWLILAQARKIQGDNQAASAAFEKAVSLAQPNATVLAEYAESLALAAQSDFSGKPTELLNQAYKLDPENVKVNALLGAALFRGGQPAQALPHLKRFLAVLDPDTEQARQITQVISSIEKNASQPAQASGTSGTVADKSANDDASAGNGKITGTIKLAGEKPPNGATLFITARAPSGPRIPYAAIRQPVSGFPIQFELSDANAMSPARLLSSAQSVVVEARISQSGQAMRQSGDRFGTSQVVTPGNAMIELTINQTVQ